MNRERLITPTSIVGPMESNCIFVFGSNEAGIHGAGAALQAHKLYGAKRGIGVGLMGSCYAIPTKNFDIETLPISEIAGYVRRFIAFTHDRPDLTFFVTQIGCGLAGYTPKDIAPLFASVPPNVALPESFWRVIDKYKKI